MNKIIGISTESSRLFLRVLQVDFQVRLFERASPVPVFDAQSGQGPREFELDRSGQYVIRYNNDDGGPGALHFRVLERRNSEETRYEVNIGTIHRPEVFEIEFSMAPDPGIAPPA
jgi:hypothetical protein